ncbi:DNA adenine methyltransferase YhdJ [Gimesia alba]|uniref:Methyltransferase n=1 Tax=Gimesia alba TaxID=2527973 RepID=A0A517RB70_9PLAN|nr:site-specific DNA-methyltransferase [Gimesia alba]QDT41043.1 DNA adenine methyltransferase YhdJ [Gimesia alba]
MTNKFITTDCLPWMKKREDNSFNLTFGSPPYEDARSYGIDFNLKGNQWVDWMADIVCEAVRITDGLVAFVVEGKTKKFSYSGTPVLLLAELVNRGITIRKPPIFQRVGIPGSGGPDWLRNDYEFIVCATSGGKLPWSDNTAMGHPPKWAPGGEMSHRLTDGTRRNQWGGGERGKNGILKTAKSRPSHQFTTKSATRVSRDGDTQTEIAYVPPVKANPGNVIQCKVGGGLMGSKLAHENEAPFPESLVEFFVKSFCPPGGLVLDPFSGSGTTAAVALKNGRGAVGLDVRKEQNMLARRRVKTEVVTEIV